MLGELFNRLGHAIGTVEARMRGADGGHERPRAHREVAVYDPESGDVHDLDDGLDADGLDPEQAETMENLALTAGGAWLLSRLLRPRDVSWTRVVLAGLAATLVADLVGRTEKKPASGELPFAGDAEELTARLGAGVAIAAGYAALLYPRIPGPPLFRGLAFGALEILAAPRGGLMGIAATTPGVKFPLQALAMPVDEDASPLSHLAFGLTLGMLYRYDYEEE